MKKRLLAVLITAAVLVASLTVFLVVKHVRDNRPPELSAVRERVIALVNASHAVNEIFWGEGLPTYPRIYREYHERVPFYLSENAGQYTYSETSTSNKLYYYVLRDETYGDVVAYQYCLKVGNGLYVDVQSGASLTIADKIKYRYARKTTDTAGEALFSLGEYRYIALPDYEETEAEFYYTSSDQQYYDYVRDDAGYLTTSEIKAMAESVYAMDFLSSVYESIFTGITVSGDSAGTLYARYIDYLDSEGRGWLMKSNLWKSADVARVYLFDTMRMSESRKSKRTDVYIDIDTYVPGDEANLKTVTVAITLQNGSWFLNAATY